MILHIANTVTADVQVNTLYDLGNIIQDLSEEHPDAKLCMTIDEQEQWHLTVTE